MTVTWKPIETVPAGGDYVRLRESVRSGRARGTVREHVGWAIYERITGKTTCWRWDERRAAPVKVKADAWAAYERRKVTYRRPMAGGILGEVRPIEWRIGRREAERRVIRALKTCAVQPSVRPMGHKSCLASMVAEQIGGHGGDADEEVERFRPTPADMSDMLIAMQWFARLATPKRLACRPKAQTMVYEQRLIWLRASPRGSDEISIAELARILKRSDVVIRSHYEAAVTEVWANANTPWGCEPEKTRDRPPGRGLDLSADARQALGAG